MFNNPLCIVYGFHDDECSFCVPQQGSVFKKGFGMFLDVFVPFNKVGHLQPVKQFLLEPTKNIETQLLTIQREISSRAKCRISQKNQLLLDLAVEIGAASDAHHLLRFSGTHCFMLETIWKQIVKKTCLFRTTAIRSM